MTRDGEAGRDEGGVLADVRAAVAAAAPGAPAIAAAMARLKALHPAWHWVGVYRLAGDELVVGPYVGPTTDHTRIKVGRGVCGTAVATGENQIVGDVRELDNYLACNLETRSEIVVLVRDAASGAVIGQIDVDGTVVDGFGPRDETLLTQVAELLAPHFSRL
jgi:GAF domain-containing protein